MFSISEKLKEDFIKNSTKVSLLVKGETISKKCSTYFNYKEFYPKERCV